jgi:hypothetical protein
MTEPSFRSHADPLSGPPYQNGGLAGVASTPAERMDEVPVEAIGEAIWRPSDAPDAAYPALKSSVRASGILQPLLLRPGADGRFQVVSGVRRLRAARETGQSAVPALVRELSDLETLVGGWDAMLRAGLTTRERGHVGRLLLAAGMGEIEVEALLATVPERRTPPPALPGAIIFPEPPGTGAPTAPVLEVLDAGTPAAEAPGTAPVAVLGRDANAALGEAIAAGDAAWPVLAADALAAIEPFSAIIIPPVSELSTPVRLEAVDVVALRLAMSPQASAEPAPLPAETAPSGWPAPDRAAVWLAPARPDAPIAIDPVRFPLGPLPPLDFDEAALVTWGQPAPAGADDGAAVLAPAGYEAARAGAEPVIVALPDTEAAAEPPKTVLDGPPVTAPGGDEATEVATAAEGDASALALSPGVKPVRAEELVLARRRKGGRVASVRWAVLDPRTVATVGVAAAVGSVVFIIVAVLLGAGAGRPLTIAIVTALVGFALAFISLVLPRREP